MTQIEKLTAWHKAQLGTGETPSGSNNVRYNTLYYGREVQGTAYPWCMAYIWCGFYECGMSALFYGGGKTASCTALYDYAVKHSQLVTSGYREGDILIYSKDGTRSGIYHTGYCTGEKVNGKWRAIEGNYSDRVQYMERGENEIIGAYRAAFDNESGSADNGSDDANNKSTGGVTVMLPQLSKGSTGEAVRSAQLLLIGRGFSCGPDGADGEYGTNTRAAVVQFQSTCGLAADGVVGINTWTRLLRGE